MKCITIVLIMLAMSGCEDPQELKLPKRCGHPITGLSIPCPLKPPAPPPPAEPPADPTGACPADPQWPCP